MHLEFADGEAGFREAVILLRQVRRALDADPEDSAEIQLLDALRSACEAQLSRPEFESLKRDAGIGRPEDSQDSWWRRLFGPSRREVLLSAQRSAALERAERAERSAFEALAETARVARERDEIGQKLAALRSGENRQTGDQQ